MNAHSKIVTDKKGNKMTKHYIRGGVIWLNYYVDEVRKQKSTKLKNTPQNIKIVTSKIIPLLDAKIATGEIYKKKPQTFGYYGSIFLKEKKNLKSYSVKSLQWQRVIEFFKHRDVDTITRFEIKQYLNSLNLKTSSITPFKTCIAGVFEIAIDDGVMKYNPALNIKMPRDKKEPIEYYSKEEVSKLINASSGLFRVYLLIAFNTGLRSGEILGLQIGDFEEKFISIKRSISKGVIGSGKTWNAIRKVPYPKFVLEEVKKVVSNNIFIFDTIDDAGKLDYIWRQTVKLADVKKIRLYCTRHTFATHMLTDRVVSINELAGLLGHSSAKTTLDRYASVMSSDTLDFDADFSLFCDTTVTVGKKMS